MVAAAPLQMAMERHARNRAEGDTVRQQAHLTRMQVKNLYSLPKRKSPSSLAQHSPARRLAVPGILVIKATKGSCFRALPTSTETTLILANELQQCSPSVHAHRISAPAITAVTPRNTDIDLGCLCATTHKLIQKRSTPCLSDQAVTPNLLAASLRSWARRVASSCI